MLEILLNYPHNLLTLFKFRNKNNLKGLSQIRYILQIPLIYSSRQRTVTLPLSA